MPRNYEACRLYPAPFYYTVEPERMGSVNEEEAVVLAEVGRGGPSGLRSLVGRDLSRKKNEVRNTMLMAGTWYQKTVLAMLSVLSVAQVNMQWETGMSPLHCPAVKGNIAMIKILLK